VFSAEQTNTSKADFLFFPNSNISQEINAYGYVEMDGMSSGQLFFYTPRKKGSPALQKPEKSLKVLVTMKNISRKNL
jgi:hypothetical protein